MARMNLEERLNKIEEKICEKSFRENKGLGNEVGYYIFDYAPGAELEVQSHIAYLKDRINSGNKGFRILEFNLFHTMIQVLDSIPVVLFYPGEYSGQDLKLFGTMDSKKYYRAFRLV